MHEIFVTGHKANYNPQLYRSCLLIYVRSAQMIMHIHCVIHKACLIVGYWSKTWLNLYHCPEGRVKLRSDQIISLSNKEGPYIILIMDTFIRR